jgi:hypothetical protein
MIRLFPSVHSSPFSIRAFMFTTLKHESHVNRQEFPEAFVQPSIYAEGFLSDQDGNQYPLSGSTSYTAFISAAQVMRHFLTRFSWRWLSIYFATVPNSNSVR